MSRLSALHIHIIGIVVVIAVAAGLYYTLIPKAVENVATQEKGFKEIDTLAATLPQRKKELQKAQDDKRIAEVQYTGAEKQYMPVFGFQKTRLAMMRYVFEPNRGKSWPERFIKAVRIQMQREQKTNGIQWLNPDVIGYPSMGPDPNVDPSFFSGDQTQPIFKYAFPVQVQAKNMDRLMKHIKAWQQLKNAGVPVIEGLQVAGNSPQLQATYNVTLTIVLRKNDRMPAVNPRIGGMGGASTARGPSAMGGGMGRGPVGAGPRPAIGSAGGSGGGMRGGFGSRRRDEDR
jgi:hypothetical protein